MSKCDICHSSDDWCDHCGTCHKCLGKQIDEDKNKIAGLLKENEQKDAVIEAAKEFIDTNVSDWKAQDAAYIRYEKALSQLEDK